MSLTGKQEVERHRTRCGRSPLGGFEARFWTTSADAPGLGHLVNAPMLRVHTLCQGSGLGLSDAVRVALRATMAPQAGNSGAPNAPRPFCVPDRILSRTRKYLAWANASLKAELRQQFDKLFALAFVCKKLFPKPPGIAEISPIVWLDKAGTSKRLGQLSRSPYP